MSFQIAEAWERQRPKCGRKHAIQHPLCWLSNAVSGLKDMPLVMFVAPLFCWALPFFSSLAVWRSVSCFSPLLLECCGPLHLSATTSMATAYTHACTHTWECTKNTCISCWPIFVCLRWRCGGLLPWRQSDRAAQEAGDCLGWTITLPVQLRCEFIHLFSRLEHKSLWQVLYPKV